MIIENAFKEKKSVVIFREFSWDVTFYYKEKLLSVIVGVTKVDDKYPISIDVYHDESKYFWFYNQANYRNDIENLKNGLITESEGSLSDFIEDSVKSDDIKSYKTYMSMDDLKEMFKNADIDPFRYAQICIKYRERQLEASKVISKELK